MQTELEERGVELAGATRGVFAGFTDAGEPLVDCHRQASLVAVSTVALAEQDIGSEIVLLYEEGDQGRPIIVGVIRAVARSPRKVDVTVDSERLIFDAKQEIVLRCGPASITLTRAGKVLIRGAYVSSRSSGANRIKGASIQLN